MRHFTAVVDLRLTDLFGSQRHDVIGAWGAEYPSIGGNGANKLGDRPIITGCPQGCEVMGQTRAIPLFESRVFSFRFAKRSKSIKDRFGETLATGIGPKEMTWRFPHSCPTGFTTMLM